MARVLIISDNFPSDRTNGRDLRVSALCKELSQYHDCSFAAISNAAACTANVQRIRFSNVVSFPACTKEKQPWTRNFRTNNSRYMQLTSPEYYRRTVTDLKEIASRWRSEAVVCFAPAFAEVAEEIQLPKLLDKPDCDTLTMERALAYRGAELPLLNRAQMRLQLFRESARQRHFLNGYDLTTTIAEPDRRALLDTADIEQARVIVVPNGVAPALMRCQAYSGRRTRSVVFWGNLDFPPNWTAISHFYERIFLPYLAPQNVEWHIVGRGAGDRLRKMAGHPLIQLAGFQEDLLSFVQEKGVMINPMTEGSGLKNKVLEAFAMRIPVVSTALGVEAIDGEAGRHFLVADDAAEFSRLVLDVLDNDVLTASLTAAAYDLVQVSYTWESVGVKFNEAVKRLTEISGIHDGSSKRPNS